MLFNWWLCYHSECDESNYWYIKSIHAMMKNYVLQKKQKVLFCKQVGVPWHPWHPRCRRPWYLGLFASYVCDLFFIFSHIFIIINHISSFKLMYLFCVHFLYYLSLFSDEKVDKESENFSNSKSSASRFGLAFAWFFLPISTWRCL